MCHESILFQLATVLAILQLQRNYYTQTAAFLIENCALNFAGAKLVTRAQETVQSMTLEFGSGCGILLAMVGLLAGLVKGVVGFAMPMALISGSGSIVSPKVALAGLIVTTLVAKLWQGMRGAGARRQWARSPGFRSFGGAERGDVSGVRTDRTKPTRVWDGYPGFGLNLCPARTQSGL